MAEQYIEQVHTGAAVLDIGQDIGALIIYTREELRGKEIEVSPKGNHAHRVHTAVLERRVNGRTVFAALFLALPAGDYTIWSTPIGEITIDGGAVAEVDWRNSNISYVAPSHGHNYGTIQPMLAASLALNGSQTCNEQTSYGSAEAIYNMLPPRYRNGKVASAAPMGSAPLRYTEDGQVAWDQMWTDYCDLALAGGPPHRDTLLEPVAPETIEVTQDAYERVVAEIERGLRLVTGLPTVRSESPGWVGLQCEDEEMVHWLLCAIGVENVCVQREGTVLFLPAGPAFRLEKEIKNVITVVAKTHHYWTEHRNANY